MPSVREARAISLAETRLDRITTISSAPSQRTFFRFIPTQLQNESSPANQPKTAGLKSDRLLDVAKSSRRTHPRTRDRKHTMDLSLQGRAALVTGANGGLGSHFAQTLAKAGAKVAVAARRLDSLRAVCDAIAAAGGHAEAIALDVTDPASVARAFDDAADALGPITVVVN